VSLTVLISGASSGLGRSLALQYAKQGATLGLIARRRELLKDLSQEIPNAAIYVADVRDSDAMQAVAHDFVLHHGQPDIVIANAGISRGVLTEYAEDGEVFADILATNVNGMLHIFQPFISHMRTVGSGRLVGVASVAGYRGLPGGGAYSASKAATIAYLESLRVEMHGSGVSVITVCPGYIITPMTAGNPFYMPFLMSAEDMADKIIRVIDRRKLYAVIPWQMAIVARALRLLPNFLYDRLFANAPRKPR
jgi:short-subunit dehydrogenase